MDMNENVPRYRAGQVVLMGTAELTTSQTSELRQLFELVADNCDAAGELLRRADGHPEYAELSRLRELRARVDAMMAQVQGILG